MKKAQNFAGFAQVILLLIIAVAVVGAYYFGTLKNKSGLARDTDWWGKQSPFPLASAQPSSDPISGWKTYTNEEYSFSLKYPEDRKIEESENKIFEFVTISQKYPKPNIQIFPTNAGFLDNNPYIDSDITKQEKVKFNGMDATHLLVTSETGLEVDYLLVGKNNQYFIISYENYDPLQSQILSTFKFTK